MNKQTLEISDLVKVESSNIDMVGYNGDTTYVQFKNGSVYSYPKTDRKEFEALAKAESVGSHFAKTYRGKQDYQKLEDTVLKKSKLSQEELEAQVIGRLYREGQKEKVNAIFLVSDSGSDPVVMDILALKKSQQDGINDPNSLGSKQESDDSIIKEFAKRYIESRGGSVGVNQ